MSSRRKGSNESKDMWLKVNQKSLMKFEGVFTRFSGHFGMFYLEVGRYKTLTTKTPTGDALRHSENGRFRGIWDRKSNLSLQNCRTGAFLLVPIYGYL